MLIKEAEKSAGLQAKTIRYYEEIGLIRPSRQHNGYRDYAAEDIHRLRFLQRARGLGFSIEDCRALLSLYDEKGRESADVRAIAEAHLAEIDRKIRELNGMRKTLAHLIHACHGDDRPDCPILNDLAGFGDDA